MNYGMWGTPQMPAYNPGMYQSPYQPGYQMQQPAQTANGTNSVGITGRVIQNVGDVQVQEVPTDGTMAWFPAADGSCVYGKRWTPDGSIATVRFVPDQTEEKHDGRSSVEEQIGVINDRISELFDVVEDMSDRLQRKTETRRTRKVADDA